jgi:circadian clock protein KaiB
MPCSSDRATQPLPAAISPRFVLRLFVAGAGEQSKAAIRNVRQVCEEHLENYDLRIIDVYQTPLLAAGENIVATPTLLLLAPRLPRVVGNLSHDRVLAGMRLESPLTEPRHE